MHNISAHYQLLANINLLIFTIKKQSWFAHKYWAANQYIRMISEGSCDTEDWSNDAENSALPSQE